jgi:hypothetical protein
VENQSVVRPIAYAHVRKCHRFIDPARHQSMPSFLSHVAVGNLLMFSARYPNFTVPSFIQINKQPDGSFT